MKHLIVLGLIGVTLLGCKKENTSCGSVFFGGEIINPNSDFVVIFDDSSMPVDTLYLDKDNRFLYKIDNVNSGLHSFYHGGEEQFMILEPNDSVMLRLNTLDFDESLVFSGYGSKKNNYFISLFLELESEREKMYEVSKKEPLDFKRYLDSIKSIRYNQLNKFSSKYKGTDLFNRITKATIDYHYYAHHELYPFRHFGNDGLANRQSIPDNFYNYRKDISYDIDELKIFNPYTNFLYPHIHNLSLDRYFEKSGDTVFNSSSTEFNLAKLHIIDSLIENNLIKNRMLKNVTRNYLSFNASDPNSALVYESYLDKSTDKDYSRYIENLYQSLQKLLPGNPLPAVEVINIKNQTLNLNSVIRKPTVISFWSTASKYHFKESHLKVKKMKELYPEMQFVSINLNSDNNSGWKKMLKKQNFPMENEYRFRDTNIAKKILAINDIWKVMIIDANGEIIANTKMFSQEFKDTLEKLNTPQ